MPTESNELTREEYEQEFEKEFADFLDRLKSYGWPGDMSPGQHPLAYYLTEGTSLPDYFYNEGRFNGRNYGGDPDHFFEEACERVAYDIYEYQEGVDYYRDPMTSKNFYLDTIVNWLLKDQDYYRDFMVGWEGGDYEQDVVTDLR